MTEEEIINKIEKINEQIRVLEIRKENLIRGYNKYNKIKEWLIMKYLVIYIDKIINKYMDKIGEVGTEEYNENLDEICSDLLDLRYRIKNIDNKIEKELGSDK